MKLKDLTANSWDFIISHPEKKEQGVWLWYKGVPYPRRVYYDRLNDPNYGLRALEKLGLVKKFILSLFHFPGIPFLSKKAWNKFLLRIAEMSRHQLSEFILQDDEWSVPVWELGKLIRIFLEEIGFKDSAFILSQIVMCGLEFDNAWRYRAQDIIGEYNINEKPRKELKRLFNILKKRDLIGVGKQWNVYERVDKVLQPLLWILLVPKINKAFKKAIESVDLKKIQFDDNDRFHFAFWRGYDYEGKTFEQRFEPYAEMYKNAPFRKKEDPYELTKFLIK